MDDKSQIRNAYFNLKEVVKILSLSYEDQCKSFLPIDLLMDDIVSSFETTMDFAKFLMTKQQISYSIITLLEDIQNRFSNVSLKNKNFEKAIWNIEGFKSHPFWKEQRRLARELLLELEKIRFNL